MNPTTELLLLMFARDWYAFMATQYQGDIGKTLKSVSDAIQEQITTRFVNVEKDDAERES